MSAADLQRELSRLRDAFIMSLPEKLLSIASAYANWKKAFDAETAQVLHRRTHGLTGAGATYGLPAISHAARRLEQQLNVLFERQAAATTQELSQLDELLAALAAEIGKVEPIAGPAPLESRPARPLEKSVLLLTSDERQSAASTAQLATGGYTCRSVSSFEALSNEFRRKPARIIIVDEAFWNGPSADDGLAALAELGVPRVFLASDFQISSRLHAVRAGAAAVLMHPLDNGAIIKLDELLGLDAEQPYRVLIVEDDEALAAYYAAVLRRAEMIVEVVSNPLDVLGPISEFRPELVLLDLHMPACSGDELCRVLRQREDLIGVPIMFLSAETSWEKQTLAMAAGGDDFMLKPITADRLVAAVLHRARRLRKLGGYIARDSLTGLANHASFKERLKLDVSRAIRERTPLTLAIFDLDHFKSVNDTHGHAAGDRVLRSVASLVRDALRQTDTVGRIGGEEFGIILPGADEANALRILEGLRRSFAEVVHPSEAGEFQVTFSCGVAGVPPPNDPVTLIEWADKALYRAKRMGRNRVAVLPLAERETNASAPASAGAYTRRMSTNRLRSA